MTGRIRAGVRRPDARFFGIILGGLLILTRSTWGQAYTPVFKSVDMQATIAPLGEMVEGQFFGHRCIAAISESEKAIYFFEPDTMENLILTNVVSLPDTPVAMSKGREVVIENSGRRERPDELAILMKPKYVILLSFGQDGQPVLSEKVSVDPYATSVRAVDMETSGSLDMVAFGKFSLGLSVEKNTGTGQFQTIQAMPGPLGNVPFSDIAFTDFNGDLVPDLAALDWVNRKLLIFYGRGDGTFAQPVSFPLKAEPSVLSVADLFGNGYPDIVVGYTRLAEIDIFGGDGFGRFFLRQSIKTAAPVSKFAVADFTGDGTMDIVALSRSAKELMVFAYDPLTRQFGYSGVLGTGELYDDITPFYFPNRIRADLVASSSEEKFLKVFKSVPAFGKSPAVFVPVCPNPDFVAVTGTDSSNFMVFGNGAGQFTTRYAGVGGQGDPLSAIDWRSDGAPVTSALLPGAAPRVLTDYENAEVVTLNKIDSGAKRLSTLTAEAAAVPFSVGGEAIGDSIIIGTAYRVKADSSVGISVFTTTGDRTEFLEQDYSVGDTQNFVFAGLVFSPFPSFLRGWNISPESIKIASTNLRTNRSTFVETAGIDARLINLGDNEPPVVLLHTRDSLSVFSVHSSGSVDGALIELLGSMPFDSSNFQSVKLGLCDSMLYMAYVNKSDRAVFLYRFEAGRLRFVTAWHVAFEPADLAISPFARKIFFLDASEAYVSIHNF